MIDPNSCSFNSTLLMPSFVSQASPSSLVLIVLTVIPAAAAIYTHRHLEDILDQAIANQNGMLAKLAYAGGARLPQDKRQHYVDNAFQNVDLNRMKFLCSFPDFKKVALSNIRTTKVKAREETYCILEDIETWIGGGCRADRKIFALATGSDEDFPIIKFEALANYCVDGGMDIHQQNRKGNTPLHDAARVGFLKVARNLVERGADVNVRNRDLMTPLCVALLRGQSEVAEYLIDAGADVHSMKASEIPEIYGERSELLEPLSDWKLEKIPPELTGKERVLYNASPIHLAACVERDAKPISTSVIEKLLQKGADVNAIADYRTPVDAAMNNDQRCLENIQYLIKQGGTSVELDWILCFFMQNIMEVKSRNNFLAKLLDLGADINCFNRNGYTPLHLVLKALEEKLEETAEFLIRRGANVMLRNAPGKIPFDLNRGFALKWLRELPTVSLHSLALNRQLTGKQSPSTFLLSRLHETDKEGKTLLHWAAENGDEEIMNVLVEKGADPAAQDVSGKTPVDYYRPLADMIKVRSARSAYALTL